MSLATLLKLMPVPHSFENRNSEWEVLDPIRPGIDPLGELRKVFEKYCQDDEEIRKLNTSIKNSSDSSIPNIVSLPDSKKYLVVVDQFEELFTVCSDETERLRFIQLITQVSEIADSRLAVIITMRADFLEPCLHYPSLTQLVQDQAVYMPPLVDADLEEAIVKPLRLQGYSFGEGLLGAILRDVGKEQGILPLLQFALTELWEKRDRQNHQLTLDQYQDPSFGGVIGALDRYAERIYTYKDFLKDTPKQSRSPQEQKWIERIFLKLVRTGDGEKDARQRQDKDKLLYLDGDNPNARNAIAKVLDDLVKGRLLVIGEGGQKIIDRQEKALANLVQETQEIDLTHEALMDGWQRFSKWRKVGRELRRLGDRLNDALKEWQKNPKDENLMMGGLLAQVREQWRELEPDLPHVAKEFYQQSNSRDRERITTLKKSFLREKAERVTDLLSAQPVDGLVMAIQSTGYSLSELDGEVYSPVQTSLNRAAKLSRERNCFKGHNSWVNGSAFIPNSDLIVSGSDDKTLRLWNLQGNSIGKPFQGHEKAIRSIAVSHKGDYIASCSNDKTIRLWDLQGNSVCESFRGHEDDVISIAFSSDDQYIISGSKDKTLRLWDQKGNQIGIAFLGHEDTVGAVTFRPAGSQTIIVSGSRDRTIRLWDVQGNPIGKPFEGHKGTIGAVAFSPDGEYIVSGSRDRTIRLWDILGNPIGKPFEGHGGAIICVTFSPDGQYIISGSEDRTIRVWDLQGQQFGKSFQGHGGSVNSIAFSADIQHIISASEDKTIRIWDFQSFLREKQFKGGQPILKSVSFSPDGQHIVSAGHYGVQLWDFNGNLVVKQFQESVDVNSVAFSPDGQYIVSGGRRWGNYIRLWNSSGNLVDVFFDGHEDYVSSVAFSPYGQYIVSGSNDGTLRLWNMQGKQVCDPFYGHHKAQAASWGSFSETASVSCVAFSPDGQYIISGGDDRSIRLWDLQGNQVCEILYGHQEAVLSVAFSPDGQYIVSCGNDRSIRLWDLQGNQVCEQLYGHSYSVNSVVFSPDGQYIVSAGMEGTVKLWNLRGEQVGEPLEGGSSLYSVALSSDGKYIASCGEDGRIWLWQFGDWESWLQVGCERLQYHPIFKNSSTEVARAAFAVCEKYSWSSVTETARSLVKKGKLLAYRRDVDGALSCFREALELVPTLGIEPEVEAHRPEALLLVMQGRLLALQQNVEGAIAKFQEALKLAPDLPLNSLTEAQRYAVPVLIKHGTTLAKQDGDVLGAIAKFRQAVKLDPTLNLDPEVEAKRLASPTLVEQGKRLVNNSNSKVNVSGAIAKFRQAVKLDPTLNLDPEVEAKRLASQTLVEQGKSLVNNSCSRVNVSGAIAKFRQAVKLDPTLNLDPEVEAKRLASQALVEQGKSLVNNSYAQVDISGAIAKFRQAVEIDPTLNLDPEVEAKRLLAASLIKQGILLAEPPYVRKLDLEGAIAKFRQAVEIDPTLNLDPEVEAKRLAAATLIRHGTMLVSPFDISRDIDVKGAISKFQEALKLDPTLKLDPEVEAKRMAAPKLIERGRRYIQEGKIKEAVSMYIEAKVFDPSLDISATDWNSLCWFGSLHEYATNSHVINACELAVAAEPKSGSFRDSRGFNRALTGNLEGAIEDFEAFINLADNKMKKEQRQRWVDTLRAKENPFTPEEIKTLFIQ